VLDNERAGNDADAGADPEDRGHQPDAAGDLLARELIANDPEREREDPAAQALDHPRHDQQQQRV